MYVQLRGFFKKLHKSMTMRSRDPGIFPKQEGSGKRSRSERQFPSSTVWLCTAILEISGFECHCSMFPRPAKAVHSRNLRLKPRTATFKRSPGPARPVRSNCAGEGPILLIENKLHRLGIEPKAYWVG